MANPTTTATEAKDEITFFDLPSHHKGEGKISCFSFNPWKTRLVLNYKHLPYKTTWVEYPDLKSTLSALGLPPNEPGTAFADYSSPAIILPPTTNSTSSSQDEPKGKPLMHSLPIARTLDRLYPSPTLHLETDLHLEAEKVVEALALVVWWDGLVYVQDVCLSTRSREFFKRTRKEVFGATLEELRDLKGGEGAWLEAERKGGVLEGMKGFLGRYKRDDGPFVLGSQVSYADFIVVALLECMSRVDAAGWERMKRFDAAFGQLHKACEAWLEKDD